MKSRTLRLFIVLLVGAVVFNLLSPLSYRAYSQAPTPTQTIQSDDLRVLQLGQWTSQSAESASGGKYLYSRAGSGLNGQPEEVLALAFLGQAIEVIYVAGPQLGTLAVEVDGTVLRTVITSASATAYGQATRVDYLDEGPHTLEVYAQEGGVVAIDAFVITPHETQSASAGGVNPALTTYDDGNGTTFTPSSETITPPTFTTRASTCFANNSVFSPTEPDATGGGLFPNFSALSNDGRFMAFSFNGALEPGDTNNGHDAFVYDFQTCLVTRVSVPTGGGVGNASSFGGYEPSITNDGRYVAFTGSHSNLVAGDTNAVSDIFVHDRQNGTTVRVSLTDADAQSAGGSFTPDINANNGRYIVFESSATDLVPGDTNGFEDVFIRDTVSNTTSRISVATGGAQATSSSDSASISADGTLVVFDSSATDLVAGGDNAFRDIFLRNLSNNTTTRITPVAANGSSQDPQISNDGRYVAFSSTASNLVAGDTNGFTDIFLFDRNTSTTTRVSVGIGGEANGSSFLPDLSADGRYIVFESGANNLVLNDTNGTSDVFVYDRVSNTTRRVSVTSTGSQVTGSANYGAIAPNGSRVGFVSSVAGIVPTDNDAGQDIFTAPYTPIRTTDSLAVFSVFTEAVALVDTINDNPPAETFTYFSAYVPGTSTGQWIMGDWNGDGLDTPGVYVGGVFYFTNTNQETLSSTWGGFWVGINGPPVAGRFSNSGVNDCVGVVDGVPSGGQTVFALYYTCDMSNTNPVPPLSTQWLSIPLPNPSFSGTFQFGAGDFNSDGLDSIAVRRGTSIAFGNVAPSSGPVVYDLAQFIGAPANTDEGAFLVGDWDGDGVDSFGLFYQSGEFFYRNDLQFNSGIYFNQSIGSPFGPPGLQAASWR